ncbi:MAG: HAMP domain-containing sensor histidine kinase [Salinivirgaceae bacterium]
MQQANATKDQFISILGHDLRNPFTTLLGFSELLVNKFERYDRETLKGHLRAIHETSKHTYNLLDNLLEWSRIQGGKTELSVTKTSIYNIAYETVMLLNDTAKAKHITIKMNVPQDIEAHIDSEMIKTVIRNLVSNAIKFTYEHGTVFITANKTEGNLQVGISDTGAGMPPETINSLFKVGKTKSKKGTNGEQGTGFGLLLCKEFIDKHHGKIWADSQIGKGSHFKFTLPLNRSFP